MILILFILTNFIDCQLPSIEWMGINWTIKDTGGRLQGPGPNVWAKQNVKIDQKGYLHLMIQKINGSWTSSEMWTPTTFGYGRFTWQMQGPIVSMNQNLVLGLFLYAANKTMGPDGTNQIDIQLSRWGVKEANNVWYSVYPNYFTKNIQKPVQSSLMFQAQNKTSVYTFTWTKQFMQFDCYQKDNFQETFKIWTLTQDFITYFPEAPLALHMNFWVFKGLYNKPDDHSIQFVIKSFVYEQLFI